MQDFPFSKAFAGVVLANVISGLVLLGIVYHLRGRIGEFWRLG